MVPVQRVLTGSAVCFVCSSLALTMNEDVSAILDLAALNDLRDMLGDALAEIGQSFLQGLDAEVGAVTGGVTSGAAAVRAAAHSLKGSAGNMGGRQLAAVASEIEKAAMANDLARCQVLMPQLVAQAASTRQALGAYFSQA